MDRVVKTRTAALGKGQKGRSAGQPSWGLAFRGEVMDAHEGVAKMDFVGSLLGKKGGEQAYLRRKTVKRTMMARTRTRVC